MSDKRQNNQLVLALSEEGRSEAPKASQEGSESRTAKCETERPASHEQLMEEVCERDNCWQAYEWVKANSGNAGSSGTGSYVIAGSVGTSPHKRRAAHTALGIWRTVQPSLSRFPLLTSIRSVFLGCSMPMRNPLNRRTRTRIYGGCAGINRRGAVNERVTQGRCSEPP